MAGSMYRRRRDMTRYDISYAPRCPFYKGHRKVDILCEGITKGATTINRLRCEKRREDFMDLYCNCDWESCRIAEMLFTEEKN